METGFIIVLALVGLVVRLVIHSSREQHRQLKETHRVPDDPPPPKPRAHRALASATPGELVTLTGKIAAAGDPISTLLTGRSCIGYLVRAEVWQSRKMPHLVAQLREAKVAPFTLQLGDGAVSVDGGVDLAVTLKTKRVTPRDPEAPRALLAAHKLERFADSSDFEEALVQNGDVISVSGVLVREHEVAGYRGLPIERLRLVAGPRYPVTITAR